MLPVPCTLEASFTPPLLITNFVNYLMSFARLYSVHVLIFSTWQCFTMHCLPLQDVRMVPVGPASGPVDALDSMTAGQVCVLAIACVSMIDTKFDLEMHANNYTDLVL